MATVACASEKKITPTNEGTFSHEIETTMTGIEKKLHTLDQKITTSTVETKKDLKKQYEQLLEKKKDLSKKLDEAKNLSQEKWENVKSSIKDVAKELETKIDSLIDG